MTRSYACLHRTWSAIVRVTWGSILRLPLGGVYASVELQRNGHDVLVSTR